MERFRKHEIILLVIIIVRNEIKRYTSGTDRNWKEIKIKEHKHTNLINPFIYHNNYC